MCGVVCAIDKQTCTRPAQKLFINVRLMSESQALCLSLSLSVFTESFAPCGCMLEVRHCVDATRLFV